MTITHHKTSKGTTVAIVDMNPYHLHNAIKKLANSTNADDVERHAALKAEQDRRGGPPEDAK